MKKIYLLLLSLLLTLPVFSQQITIGTGTSVQIYPLGNYYGYECSASLYKATELVNSGNISALSWYAETGGLGSRPIKIYLKETTANTITASNWSNMKAGATLVYDSSVTPVVGWNTFILNTTFNYSGNLNNLLVLVEANYGESGNGEGSSGNNIRYSSSSNTHMYIRKDNSEPTDNGTVDSNRPNVQINFGPLITCFAPPTVSYSAVTNESVTISWEASVPAPENGYEYEIRTSGIAGSGAEGLAATGTTAAGVLTANIAQLSSNTVYNIYVRSICTSGNISLWTQPIVFQTFQNPAVIPYTENFEVNNEWTFVNGSQPNKWFIGSAVNNGGTKSLYVSNDNGVTNAYTTNETSYIHAYRDIAIDTGTTNVSVSFDWKAMGEGTTTKYDYLKVWLVPTTYTPTAGESMTIENSGGIRIGGDYNLSNIWKSEDVVVDVIAYQGQSVRLVLEWLNDSSSGDQPPAAVDNISVVKILCMEPSAVTVSGVTKNTASVSWTASPSTLQGYQYELRTTGQPGSGTAGLTASGDLSDISHVFASLTPATQYTVYIRTKCDNTNYSSWTLPVSFTTLCDYPDVLTTTPGTLCGIGTTTLSATTEAAGTLRWYTSPTSAIPVYTGASFQTPEISETTSYYVAASAGTANDNIYVGTATTASSSLGYSPFTYGWGGNKYQYTYMAEELIAAGLSAGPITSLALDVVTAGASRSDFTIYLGHTTQAAATTTHVSGTTLVYSNANQAVTVGSNQYTFATPFQWDGVSNLVVQFCWSNNNTGVSSEAAEIRYHVTPFNSLTATYADNKTAAQILATMSGSVDSSGNTLTYANRANMVFNSTCISPRIEVIATVNSAPALELSTAALEICEGNDSTAVTITTGASDYDVYTWEPSTGVSGDAQNGWIFNPSVSTAYTLTASQSAGTMCVIIKELQINVKELPEFQSLPEELNVCVGEIQELDGGVTLGEQELLNETFSNGTTLPANWQTQGGGVSVVNANTAGGTANELKITGSSFSNVVRRAYYGPIDTSGLQELTLQWRNFLNHYSGNYNYSVKVQTSSNGTTWNNTSWVTNPVTATQAAGIVSTVINTADVGSSTFYVSFTVEGVDFGMHDWNIDDVLLTADQEYELEWSPSDNLYEDAEATVPYSGTTPLAKVYYKADMIQAPTQYTLTITNPANCSVENTVEITTLEKPVIDPVTNPISFCDATNVEDITINTNNEDNIIKWYASLTSTAELTQISQSGTYYVQASNTACNSERVAVQITIINPQLPTVTETQYFCDAGTVANLSATIETGFTIRWYDAVAATTPLSETTDLVNGAVYYAATYHAESGCESPRIAVTAVITPTPSAIPAQGISLCQSTNFGGLQLSAMPNATLKWYASMTAAQPISSSLIVTTGTYYVSQIVNSCESVRSQIQIAVYAGLEKPAANTHNICGSGTVADLIATGAVAGAVYNWYNSATSTTPLALTAALTSGVYYVSQSIEGCESPRRSVTVKIINQTAPVVNAFVLCGSGTVADLYLPTATYVTYRWYATATSTVELAQNVALTTGTYYVARVEHGCVSQRTAVTVTIADLPSSPTGEAIQNFTVNTIGEATIADLIMDQTNIVWYITEADAKNGNNALPAEAPLVSGQTYYAVIIGTNGCPSLPTAVTVVITLGMDDFDKTNLVFYPNPTSDILNIRYKNNIDQLVVYNLLGQKVMMQRFDNNEVQLDMSALASGNYLIELHSDNQIQIIKVVRK